MCFKEFVCSGGEYAKGKVIEDRVGDGYIQYVVFVGL